MKARDKTKVTQTFHGAGMIVPYNKETQVGYREIPESTASLKKILRNVVQAETQEKADSALDVLQVQTLHCAKMCILKREQRFACLKNRDRRVSNLNKL